MDNFDRLTLGLIPIMLALLIMLNRWHTDEIIAKIDSQVVAKDRTIDSLRTKLDYCKGKY